MKISFYICAFALLLACCPKPSQATVVRFDTTLGTIDVRLFESATPESIANFLHYVTNDSWDGTFIHRSVPGFIVQGGGFSLDPDIFNTTNVTTTDPVVNEPGITNIRGTIAYAKIGGDPDSATSQWFFNLDDNAANLDFQNEGFTVFGRVIGTGMTVVDAIADLGRINAGGAFTTVPVLDVDQVLDQGNIFNSDAVIINDVFILNSLGGDYDLDNQVNENDLASWSSDFGRYKDSTSDFTDDLEVDSWDLFTWQSNFGASGGSVDFTQGDSNSDQRVNGADYLSWARDFGSTLNVSSDGNGDSVINGADYLSWARSFGDTVAVSSAITSIPEPSSLMLLGTCLLVTAMRHRR